MAKIGYWNSVGSDKGVPILATITVYDAGTANKSTIWSDVAGTTLKDNPFQTDTLGRFEFFADPAYYDIEVSGSGITTYKIENQTLGMVGSLVAHATQHKSGGSDSIKLDELAAPIDNTNLDVSTEKHGLAPKLPNDAKKFLNGVGSWVAPENWIAPTLLNSWVNHGSPNSAAGYYKDPLGRVHLRGRVDPGTWASMIFALPSGYRPSDFCLFAQMTYYSADWHACSVGVSAAGEVFVYGPTGDRVNLDGISFRAV